MAEGQQLELCVLLETPSVKALQARLPDEAAAQAVRESHRWPKDKWRQVCALLLPASCGHACRCGALFTGSHAATFGFDAPGPNAAGCHSGKAK